MKLGYDFSMVFPKIKSEDTEESFRKIFTIEPLERGYGTTLGNAMRRIALSSMPGGAITEISIKGVNSEFDVLDIIVEDITSVVFATKKINLSIEEQNVDYELRLKTNMPGKITAGMIETPPGVEIMNPDLHIATLVDDSEFNMTLIARKGIGYVMADENSEREKKSGVIFVDSIFTPVERFSYLVEDTRVGDKTNYDKLIIDITTNGSIRPEEAITMSAKILIEHVSVLENIEENIHKLEVFEEQKEIIEVHQEEVKEVENDKIETLEISNRAYNGLKRANINTIEDLASRTKKSIASLDNIGAKTVDEIERQLEELGYSFAK